MILGSDRREAYKGNTIRELLSYLNCSTIEHVTNDDISHIHSYVTTVKQSGKVRDDYVTLGEVSQEIIERARALDKDTLKTWTKLAAKSDTMQDFLKSIE